MNTFKLEIVATDKIFYDGDAELLVFPGIDGECGVMAGHELMVSPVAAGELRYTVDDEEHIAAVGDGFVEILGDRVILICDFVEKPEDIDVKRAQLAKERAEERIRFKKSEREYAHSQAALSRAMARLKVAGKSGRL